MIGGPGRSALLGDDAAYQPPGWPTEPGPAPIQLPSWCGSPTSRCRCARARVRRDPGRPPPGRGAGVPRPGRHPFCLWLDEEGRATLRSGARRSRAGRARTRSSLIRLFTTSPMLTIAGELAVVATTGHVPEPPLGHHRISSLTVSVTLAGLHVGGHDRGDRRTRAPPRPRAAGVPRRARRRCRRAAEPSTLTTRAPMLCSASRPISSRTVASGATVTTSRWPWPASTSLIRIGHLHVVLRRRRRLGRSHRHRPTSVRCGTHGGSNGSGRALGRRDDGLAHRRALARPRRRGRRPLAAARPRACHLGRAAGRALARCSAHGARADRGGGGVRDGRGVRLQPAARGLHLPLRQRADVRPAGARAGLPVRVRPRARPARGAAPAGLRRRWRRGAGGPGRRTACWSPTGPTCSARSGSPAWRRSCSSGPSQPVYVGARRGRYLPRARRHPPGHLGLAAARPDRPGVDRQPALGRGRRLRLVRPGRAARRAPCAARVVGVSPTPSASRRPPTRAEVVHRAGAAGARRPGRPSSSGSEPRNASAWSCSRPLLASALPPCGPGVPSSEVNAPPASRTMTSSAAMS